MLVSLLRTSSLTISTLVAFHLKKGKEGKVVLFPIPLPLTMHSCIYLVISRSASHAPRLWRSGRERMEHNTTLKEEKREPEFISKAKSHQDAEKMAKMEDEEWR